jgi:hypothetical protein
MVFLYLEATTVSARPSGAPHVQTTAAVRCNSAPPAAVAITDQQADRQVETET